MSILYICEKPLQGQDVARNLGATQRCSGYIKGKGVIVTWCIGHLFEQCPPDDYCNNLKPWRMEVLPVIPTCWKIKPIERSIKQLNIVKKLIKQTDHIIIATDPDREGEVIGVELLEYCKYKGKIERLWMNALDDETIQKALTNIRPAYLTKNLYYAGLARQRADWLIGMNMTMATSHLFSQKGQGVLSVGRVQTPTLNLVVQRDLEIENFVAKEYFILLVEFENDDQQPIMAKWQTPDELCDDQGQCINKAYTEAITEKIANKPATVAEYSETKKFTSAPLCFSLSSLQKIASSKFGLSAKETLNIAQSLYETHKATTYPRTDCGYLPESQLKEVKQVLSIISAVDASHSFQSLLKLCNYNMKSPTWNDKKITAHHGIIPTMNSKVDIKAMTETEFKVYDLIRRYYIAQFLESYEYLERKTTITCEDEFFKASNHIPVKQGWKVALNGANSTIDKSLNDNAIPKLKPNEPLEYVDYDIQIKQTKPPSNFTEGTLIAAMESIAKYIDDPKYKRVLKETSGIGTEATRASIIETLINRQYIDKKGKKLISTQKGRKLIDLLPNMVKNPVTTAIWEQELNAISTGHNELDDFLEDQADALESMLQQLESQT